MNREPEADSSITTWESGLVPDPMLLVSEWAERYRLLSSKSSAEPGRWRNQRTPYLVEIMDCMSTASPVQRVKNEI